jgi:hypothetical protein
MLLLLRVSVTQGKSFYRLGNGIDNCHIYTCRNGHLVTVTLNSKQKRSGYKIFQMVLR